MRVAAGAIAKKWLKERYGVAIRGYLAALGTNEIPFKSWDEVDRNPFFMANAGLVEKMEAFMDELRESGDSVGARVNVVAEGVPVGWGEPVYGRLDADIAAAMMSINAVKGVEIGAGFAAIGQKGSEHGDEMTPQGFVSNNNGGVLGGISTGQDVTVSIALKPTSSIRLPRRTIDKSGARDDGRDHRPARSLRRDPRHADRRGDARLRADGSRAAPSRAMRRRQRRPLKLEKPRKSIRVWRQHLRKREEHEQQRASCYKTRSSTRCARSTSRFRSTW